MTTPRAALAALLQALPTCQYDDDARGNPRPHCRALATVGTVSHQPTHCAEHAELLGRGVVGTRTADWADEVEQAERALAAVDVRLPEPGEVWSFDDGSEVHIVMVSGDNLVLRPLPSGDLIERSGVQEFAGTYKLERRRVEEVIIERNDGSLCSYAVWVGDQRWHAEDLDLDTIEGVAEALGARVVRR